MFALNIGSRCKICYQKLYNQIIELLLNVEAKNDQGKSEHNHPVELSRGVIL